MNISIYVCVCVCILFLFWQTCNYNFYSRKLLSLCFIDTLKQISQENHGQYRPTHMSLIPKGQDKCHVKHGSYSLREWDQLLIYMIVIDWLNRCILGTNNRSLKAVSFLSFSWEMIHTLYNFKAMFTPYESATIIDGTKYTPMISIQFSQQNLWAC